MDDDIQQLLNLRLKMMCFGLAHGSNDLTNYDQYVKLAGCF